MRLLDRLIFDLIGRYVPVVDPDALRVDLARQRATLSSVDLAPASHESQHYVFLCGSIPFRLSPGSYLQSLNLSYPGQLTTEISGLILRLVQIPFEGSVGNEAVALAFERRKRAKLAEGERQATGLFATLVKKVLPLVLHRLQTTLVNTQVIVELSSGRIVKIALERASLVSVAGRDGPSGELAKDMNVHGLRIAFDDLEVFNLSSCILELRYRSGQLQIGFRFENKLRMALSDQFAEEVVALRRVSNTWECACVFGRPSERVSNAAKEWWRYTVRVLLRNVGGLNDVDAVVKNLQMCQEYHTLHVSRLRKGGHITATERERCERIESLLSVETILLLRGKARKAVRADQAARYAAEDWLGWVVGVATSRPSSDREQTASEIRQAIAALEDAEGSDESMNGALSALGFTPGSALTLGNSLLSVDVSDFSLHILGSEDGLDIETELRTIKVVLNVDGSFSTVDLSLSVADLKVRDWQSQYMQPYAADIAVDRHESKLDRVEKIQNKRGAVVPGIDGAESSSKLFVLSAKTIGHTGAIAVQVHLAPLAIHLDISQLSPIFQVFSMLLVSSRRSNTSVVCQPAAGFSGGGSADLDGDREAQRRENKLIRPPFVSDENRAKTIASFMITEMDFECTSMQILISSGLAIADEASRVRHAIVLRFSSIACRLFHDSHNEHRIVSLSMGARAASCTVVNQTVGSREVRSDRSTAIGGVRFIRVLDLKEACFAAPRIEVSGAVGGRDVQLNDLSLNWSDAEMQTVLRLLLCVASEFKAECAPLKALDSEKLLLASIPCTQSVRMRMMASFSADLHTNESLNGILDSDVETTRSTVAAREIRLSVFTESRPEENVMNMIACGLMIVLEPNVTKVSLSEFRFLGAKNGCRVTLQSLGERRSAFSLYSLTGVDRTSGRAGSSVSLEIECGGVDARLDCTTLSNSIATYVGYYHELLSEYVSLKFDADDGPVVASSPASFRRVVLSIGSLSVDGASELSRARVAGRDCFLEWEGVIIKGHCEGLSLSDLTGNSGPFREVIHNRDVDVTGQNMRSARFHLRPGHLNLQLASLEVCILRSVFERLLFDIQYAISRIRNSIQSTVIVAHGSSELNVIRKQGKGIHSITSPESHGVLQVAVHGSRLFVVLPVSVDDSSAVGLDVPEIKIVVAPDSLLISAKRIRVVASILPLSTHNQVSQSKEWLVVASSIDLDAKREGREVLLDNAESSSAIGGLFSDGCWLEAWDIRIQSNAVLLAASQLGAVVKLFRNNLLKPTFPAPQDTTSTPLIRSSANDDFLIPATAAPKAKSSWRVTTCIRVPCLTVEFVNENEGGQFSSGLACATFGHAFFELESTGRRSTRSSSYIQTYRWSLTLSGIKLEDRRDGVPEELRHILSTPLAAPAAGEHCDSYHAFNQRDMLPPCASIKMHEYSDSSHASEMKVDICSRFPQILFSLGLVQDLIDFFLAPDIVSKNQDIGCENSVASESKDRPRTYSVPDLSPVDSDDVSVHRVLDVSCKFSVLVEVPRLFFIEQPQPCTTHAEAIEVSCKRLKLSVLVSTEGLICPGSYCRARGIQISLCAGAGALDFSSISNRQPPKAELAAHPENLAGDLGVHGRSQTSISGAGLQNQMDELQQGTEDTTSRSDRIPLLQSLTQNADVGSVRLFQSRAVTVRPPHHASTVYNMTAESACLDGTAEDLAKLCKVISRLTTATHGSATSPTLVPGISFSASDLSLNIRIPQHRLAHDLGAHRQPGEDGSSMMNLSLDATLEIAENVGSLWVQANLRHVDTFDGQAGEWDTCHMVEFAPFELRMSTISRQVTFAVSDLVRINLTPLSVKTLIHLVYVIHAAVDKREGRQGRNDAERSRHLNAITHGRLASGQAAESLEVVCALATVEIALISENLHLRCVISDVDCRVLVPLNRVANGQVDFGIGSFHVQNDLRDGNISGDGRDWSAMLSPAPRLLNVKERREIMSLLSFKRPRANRGSSPSRNQLGTQRSQLTISEAPAVVLSPKSHAIQRRSGFRREIPPRSTSRRHPFAAGVVSWYGTSGDIYVRLGLSGVDVCIEADILPEFRLWTNMVAETIASASQIHERRDANRSRLPNVFEMPREVRVVIEAIGVRLSLRAPRSQTREHWLSFQRFLETVVGSEQATNVVFHLPKVDVQQSSFDVEDIAKRLGQEYWKVVWSRSMVSQIITQLPSLFEITRVGILTALRTQRRDATSPGRRRIEGLLVGTAESNSASQRARGIHERTSVSSEYELWDSYGRLRRTSFSASPGLHFQNPNCRINMLDIAGKAMDRAVFVTGLELFLRIAAADTTLRRSGDAYKFYMPYNEDAAVMVTEKHLLFVNLESESVMEPRVTLASVTGYALSANVLLTIHCNRPMTDPPRIWSRDTGSMVEALMQSMSFTMQCRDAETAEWLLRNLPSNPTLRSLPRDRT